MRGNTEVGEEKRMLGGNVTETPYPRLDRSPKRELGTSRDANACHPATPTYSSSRSERLEMRNAFRLTGPVNTKKSCVARGNPSILNGSGDRHKVSLGRWTLESVSALDHVRPSHTQVTHFKVHHHALSSHKHYALIKGWNMNESNNSIH
jgi:hypothetical protein